MALATIDAPAVAGGVPIRSDYLVFGRPLVEPGEVDEVVATLRSGWLGTGPKTVQFEKAFADYVGGRNGVAVSSCTAALHLAMVAAGIGPCDEVVVPSMTFVATASSVLHAGATPVLCDVDPVTQTMRVEDVERVRSKWTRAIIPVHFAGRAADLTALEAYARDHGLLLINDAAHAIETMHRGRRVAGYGRLAAYSFYPTKNITTGEGGMVVTDDDELAQRVRVLRLHGLSADAWRRFAGTGVRHYDAVELGYKSNMTDLQASIGLHQLERIEAMSRRRQAIWDRYEEAFAALPLERPAPVEPGDRHALHLYTVLLDLDRLTAGRDDVARALHEEGIGTGIHYRAIHLHPYYRDRFHYEPDHFPHATAISARTLSLPLSASLTDAEVDDVVTAVTRVVGHFER